MIVELTLLSIYPAALIIAALTDIHDFKIPNWVCAVLFLGYAPTALALGAPLGLVFEGLFLGCAVLVVGFALFAVRFFGGGDAKLFAAVAPWVGMSAYSAFLFATVIVGGVLAIFLLAFRRTPLLPVYVHAPWLVRMHQNRHEIPYGVAISAGGLLVFRHTPLFQLAFGG